MRACVLWQKKRALIAKMDYHFGTAAATQYSGKITSSYEMGADGDSICRFVHANPILQQSPIKQGLSCQSNMSNITSNLSYILFPVYLFLLQTHDGYPSNYKFQCNFGCNQDNRCCIAQSS